MMIGREDLSKIRQKHIDKKIVYCSGSFDLTHAGHILFFEDCKKHGDVLVVCVGSDSDIRRNKGRDRPILNQFIRLKTIDSFKPVDYSFIGEEYTDGMHPLQMMTEIFKDLRPDICIVNEDAFEMEYRRAVAAEYGIELVILNRNCPPEFDGISTSHIFRKIKSLLERMPDAKI